VHWFPLLLMGEMICGKLSKVLLHGNKDMWVSRRRERKMQKTVCIIYFEVCVCVCVCVWGGGGVVVSFF
jgi:hypothetical protein